MFCKHCGKEIKEDSTFCPYCGKAVLGSSLGTQPETNNLSASSQTKSFDIQALVQRIIANKKVLIIIGAVLLIILLFSRCGKDGENKGRKNTLSSIAGNWELAGTSKDQYSFNYQPIENIEISKDGIKASSVYVKYAVSAKDVAVEEDDGITYYVYNAVVYKNMTDFEPSVLTC